MRDPIRLLTLELSLTCGHRWRYLEVGVDRIMTDLKKGMDMKTYMGLYTAIHNFCTAQKAVGTGGFNAHNRGGGRSPHISGQFRFVS